MTAEIIEDYRQYFRAVTIYHRQFPRAKRGTEEAVAFLRNYAPTLSNNISRTKLLKFAIQEEYRNGQLSPAD